MAKMIPKTMEPKTLSTAGPMPERFRKPLFEANEFRVVSLTNALEYEQDEVHSLMERRKKALGVDYITFNNFGPLAFEAFRNGLLQCSVVVPRSRVDMSEVISVVSHIQRANPDAIIMVVSDLDPRFAAQEMIKAIINRILAIPVPSEAQQQRQPHVLAVEGIGSIPFFLKEFFDGLTKGINSASQLANYLRQQIQPPRSSSRAFEFAPAA